MSGYDQERAEWGMHVYVERIAAGLGVEQAATYCEVADVAVAYVALADRLDRYPGRDTALVWDERQGWALAVETHSGEDLLVLAYLGRQLLPAPEAVVAEAKAVIAECPDQPAAPPHYTVGDLVAQLAEHMPAEV